jgi:hypothetical protein
MHGPVELNVKAFTLLSTPARSDIHGPTQIEVGCGAVPIFKPEKLTHKRFGIATGRLFGLR